MSDIVTCNFRDLLHHLIHSRDDPLQEVRLFADYFIRDNVRERQKVLQPVHKAQWYLEVLILCRKQLNDQALPLMLIRQ